MDDNMLKAASEAVQLLIKVLWPVMVFMTVLDFGGLAAAVWIHNIEQNLSLIHVFWTWFIFLLIQITLASSVFALEGYSRYIKGLIPNNHGTNSTSV